MLKRIKLLQIFFLEIKIFRDNESEFNDKIKTLETTIKTQSQKIEQLRIQLTEGN